MHRYVHIGKDLVMNGLVSVVEMFSLILACLEVERRGLFFLRFLDWLVAEMLFLGICAALVGIGFICSRVY